MLENTPATAKAKKQHQQQQKRTPHVKSSSLQSHQLYVDAHLQLTRGVSRVSFFHILVVIHLSTTRCFAPLRSPPLSPPILSPFSFLRPCLPLTHSPAYLHSLTHSLTSCISLFALQLIFAMQRVTGSNFDKPDYPFGTDELRFYHRFYPFYKLTQPNALWHTSFQETTGFATVPVCLCVVWWCVVVCGGVVVGFYCVCFIILIYIAKIYKRICQSSPVLFLCVYLFFLFILCRPSRC